MHGKDDRSNVALIGDMDALHARVCTSQRELFRMIAEADHRNAWEEAEARNMAHWLSMRYGISGWMANRWIAAAHALEELPALSEAFASGELSIDKIVELTRFATPDTEAGLLRWAKGVSAACIREKGNLADRSIDEAREAEKSRSLTWWYFEENSRFGLYANLPAYQGAVVARALEHIADSLPVMPGEEEPSTGDERRADALVALCSGGIAADSDIDRATVFVHAQLEGLLSKHGGCSIEGGPAIHPEIARRLLCHARVQMVVEDDTGSVVGVGRMSREPSAWMMRQIRYRDVECRFPGCGARQFTQAHHIKWWKHGGRTDLDNLILVCTFHHKLVHELGWAIRRAPDGSIVWSRPNGVRYRAGPAPPERELEREFLSVHAASV